MTIKAFEAYLAEHEAENKKFEELKVTVRAENDEELAEALSKAAADVGCEVAASEFMLDKIVNGPLDDEELEKVSGGGDNSCAFKYACYTAWKHPKGQNKTDPCLYDYLCKTIRHGQRQDIAEEAAKDLWDYIKK